MVQVRGGHKEIPSFPVILFAHGLGTKKKGGI